MALLPITTLGVQAHGLAPIIQTRLQTAEQGLVGTEATLYRALLTYHEGIGSVVEYSI